MYPPCSSAVAPRVLSTIVLACYLAAALWLIGSMQQAAHAVVGGRRAAGLSLSVAALALHAVALWQGVSAKPAFALTLGETASLVGFGIAVIAVFACWRQARFAGASALLLAVAGLVAVATNEGAREFAVERHGWELSAHIALSVLAYSLITVGTALAIALTLLDRRLRKRQPLGWLSILPAVESLESGMFTALSTGFIVLTLALFSGFFFVEDIFAQSLSRKVILSCLAWIVLAILLFGRWRFGWRGRIARNWTLGGFFILGLAYFGSKLVLENILGRHWG
jgi:ABC-type uncharacterized transport system permease subunit